LFADELAKIKSMLTVNTSPIAQALIAGKLLEHRFSLVDANTREREVYRRNLRLVDAGLRRRLQSLKDRRVSWNPASRWFLRRADGPLYGGRRTP
jgi:(S)-3,5-dihydroxyphenylglycine transaminase